MKICLAQIKPESGNIEQNIESHTKWINIALSYQADLIVFPELSISGYEPTLANRIAIDLLDQGLAVFEQISNNSGIFIAVGIPLKSDQGIHISQVLYGPENVREVYSKILLHEDEVPYFIPGKQQLLYKIANKMIAPAICYESLQSAHFEKAIDLGGQIYLASVAKSTTGVEKAYSYFPKIAKKHALPILMVNSVGPCDNFISAGNSAVWNREGNLLCHLNKIDEGYIIYDTESNNCIAKACN